MKLLISEYQYKFLIEVVNESNVLKTYNSIINAVKGLGTNPSEILKAFDYIKSKEEFSELLTMFKDKKTGYESFEEMINGEYESDNYQDVISLVKKLKDSYGVNYVFSSEKNILGNNSFGGNFRTPDVYDLCESKYKNILPQAKKFWIDWLSNPITKQKFKDNWVKSGEKNINVEGIFQKYEKRLKEITLSYIDDPSKNPNPSKNAMAFTVENLPTTVFINCSQTDKTPLLTLIHEIQHILYYIKPLNPTKQISQVFGNDNDADDYFKQILEPVGEKVKQFKQTGKSTLEKDLYSKFEKKVSEVSKKYNIPTKNLFYWVKYGEWVESEENKGYVCDETEKMSNIISIRKKFNLKPGENLTFDMIKPFILSTKNEPDISLFLSCWALKGFQDINEILNNLNQLAINSKTQNNINLFPIDLNYV